MIGPKDTKKASYNSVEKFLVRSSSEGLNFRVVSPLSEVNQSFLSVNF